MDGGHTRRAHAHLDSIERHLRAMVPPPHTRCAPPALDGLPDLHVNIPQFRRSWESVQPRLGSSDACSQHHSVAAQRHHIQCAAVAPAAVRGTPTSSPQLPARTATARTRGLSTYATLTGVAPRPHSTAAVRRNTYQGPRRIRRSSCSGSSSSSGSSGSSDRRASTASTSPLTVPTGHSLSLPRPPPLPTAEAVVNRGCDLRKSPCLCTTSRSPSPLQDSLATSRSRSMSSLLDAMDALCRPPPPLPSRHHPPRCDAEAAAAHSAQPHASRGPRPPPPPLRSRAAPAHPVSVAHALHATTVRPAATAATPQDSVSCLTRSPLPQHASHSRRLTRADADLVPHTATLSTLPHISTASEYRDQHQAVTARHTSATQTAFDHRPGALHLPHAAVSTALYHGFNYPQAHRPTCELSRELTTTAAATGTTRTTSDTHPLRHDAAVGTDASTPAPARRDAEAGASRRSGSSGSDVSLTDVVGAHGAQQDAAVGTDASTPAPARRDAEAGAARRSGSTGSDVSLTDVVGAHGVQQDAVVGTDASTPAPARRDAEAGAARRSGSSGSDGSCRKAVSEGQLIVVAEQQGQREATRGDMNSAVDVAAERGGSASQEAQSTGDALRSGDALGRAADEMRAFDRSAAVTSVEDRTEERSSAGDVKTVGWLRASHRGTAAALAEAGAARRTGSSSGVESGAGDLHDGRCLASVLWERRRDEMAVAALRLLRRRERHHRRTVERQQVVCRYEVRLREAAAAAGLALPSVGGSGGVDSATTVSSLALSGSPPWCAAPPYRARPAASAGRRSASASSAASECLPSSVVCDVGSVNSSHHDSGGSGGRGQRLSAAEEMAGQCTSSRGGAAEVVAADAGPLMSETESPAVAIAPSSSLPTLAALWALDDVGVEEEEVRGGSDDDAASARSASSSSHGFIVQRVTTSAAALEGGVRELEDWECVDSGSGSGHPVVAVAVASATAAVEDQLSAADEEPQASAVVPRPTAAVSTPVTSPSVATTAASSSAPQLVAREERRSFPEPSPTAWHHRPSAGTAHGVRLAASAQATPSTGATSFVASLPAQGPPRRARSPGTPDPAPEDPLDWLGVAPTPHAAHQRHRRRRRDGAHGGDGDGDDLPAEASFLYAACGAPVAVDALASHTPGVERQSATSDEGGSGAHRSETALVTPPRVPAAAWTVPLTVSPETGLAEAESAAPRHRDTRRGGGGARRRPPRLAQPPHLRRGRPWARLLTRGLRSVLHTSSDDSSSSAAPCSSSSITTAEAVALLAVPRPVGPWYAAPVQRARKAPQTTAPRLTRPAPAASHTRARPPTEHERDVGATHTPRSAPPRTPPPLMPHIHATAAPHTTQTQPQQPAGPTYAELYRRSRAACRATSARARRPGHAAAPAAASRHAHDNCAATLPARARTPGDSADATVDAGAAHGAVVWRLAGAPRPRSADDRRHARDAPQPASPTQQPGRWESPLVSTPSAAAARRTSGHTRHPQWPQELSAAAIRGDAVSRDTAASVAATTGATRLARVNSPLSLSGTPPSSSSPLAPPHTTVTAPRGRAPTPDAAVDAVAGDVRLCETATASDAGQPRAAQSDAAASASPPSTPPPRIAPDNATVGAAACQATHLLSASWVAGEGERGSRLVKARERVASTADALELTLGVTSSMHGDVSETPVDTSRSNSFTCLAGPHRRRPSTHHCSGFLAAAASASVTGDAAVTDAVEAETSPPEICADVSARGAPEDAVDAAAVDGELQGGVAVAMTAAPLSPTLVRSAPPQSHPPPLLSSSPVRYAAGSAPASADGGGNVARVAAAHAALGAATAAAAAASGSATVTDRPTLFSHTHADAVDVGALTSAGREGRGLVAHRPHHTDGGSQPRVDAAVHSIAAAPPSAPHGPTAAPPVPPSQQRREALERRIAELDMNLQRRAARCAHADGDDDDKDTAADYFEETMNGADGLRAARGTAADRRPSAPASAVQWRRAPPSDLGNGIRGGVHSSASAAAPPPHSSRSGAIRGRGDARRGSRRASGIAVVATPADPGYSRATASFLIAADWRYQRMYVDGMYFPEAAATTAATTTTTAAASSPSAAPRRASAAFVCRPPH